MTRTRASMLCIPADIDSDPDPNTGFAAERKTRYFGAAGAQPLDANGDPTDDRYNHGDLIGSTVLTTDGAGNADLSERYAYTAFGELIMSPTSPETRYQYAREHGYESGLLELQGANTSLTTITLQHLGHRWYQPDIGRFVQRDPIGIRGGINTYLYVHNG